MNHENNSFGDLSLDEGIISCSLNSKDMLKYLRSGEKLDSMPSGQVNTSSPSKTPSILSQISTKVSAKLHGHKLVEILQVDQGNFNKSMFWGAWIDAPRHADKFEGLSIRLAGWVIARELKTIDIEVRIEEQIITKIPVNIPRPDVSAAFCITSNNHLWGYDASVNLRKMPDKDTLIVEAVLSNDSREFLSFVKYCKY